MPKIPLSRLYTTLITQSLRDVRDEEELLHWMLLIHTHEIHLKEAVIEDSPGRLMLPGATQRYAADIISSIWPEQDERRSGNYWYRRFQLQFGDTKNAVLARRAQLDKLITRLQRNEQVARIVEGGGGAD